MDIPEGYEAVAPKSAIPDGYEVVEPNAAGAVVKQGAKDAVGGLEAAVSMASGMPAQIAGGLTGLGNYITPGSGAFMDVDEAVKRQHAMEDLVGHYEPQTDSGKQATQMLGDVGGYLSDKAGDLGASVGGEFGRYTAKSLLGMGAALSPIPGGKFVRALGKGIEREMAGGVPKEAAKVAPEPVEPAPAATSGIPPGWEAVKQDELPLDFTEQHYAESVARDKAPGQLDMFSAEGPDTVPRGNPPPELPVRQDFPPADLVDVARKQAEAQQAINDRKVQMESDVAKQTNLDFNAAERARQEAAPVPGLETKQAADRAEAAGPENTWEGEGGSIPNSQRGAVNMDIFDPAFKVVKELDNGVRMLMKGGKKPVIIAVDPAGNRVGEVQWGRDNWGNPEPSPKDSLEADWVTTDPYKVATSMDSNRLRDTTPSKYKGLSAEMYKFAAEQGNDIKASGAQTPEGKAMWQKFAENGLGDGKIIKGAVDALHAGEPIKSTLENTPSHLRREVLNQSQRMENVPQRGAIDMQALSEGLQHLMPGTRVKTADGVGRVIGHSVTLIKDPDVIREHLNDIADHATSVEDEMHLHNDFFNNKYDNIPHDKPVGAYTVQFPDGTKKRIFGEDIQKVYQGLSAVPAGQRGALNAKDIHELLQKGMDKLGAIVEKATNPKVDPFTAEEKSVLNVVGEKNYVPKPDSPEKMIADSLEGKDSPDGWIRGLWKNLQSGIIHAGEKVNSPLLKGVGRWLSYAEKSGENYIRSQVRPLDQLLTKLNTKDLIAAMGAHKDAMLKDIEPSNLSPKAAEAYAALKQAMSNVLEHANASLKALGKAPISAKDHYMASIWNGNWHVPILDKDGKLAWYVKTATRSEALRAIEHLKNDPVLSQTLDLGKSVPKYKGSAVGRKVPSDVMGAYQDMLKFFSDSEHSNLVKQAFEGYVDAQGLKFEGFNKHMQGGKANVRGFEGDKPWLSDKDNAMSQAKAQIGYLKDAYRWMPMQEAMANIKQVLSHEGLNNAQPNNMQIAKAYTAQAMGVTKNMWKDFESATQHFTSAMPYHLMPANLAKFVSSMKTMTYLQQLGLSGGYMIATPLQSFLLGPARHMKLSGEGFDHNAMITMAKSMHDLTVGLIGHIAHNYGATYRVPLTKLGTAAFKYMEENGIISQNIFHENSGLGEYAAIHGAKQLIGSTISFPEKIARAATFMSFAHHLEASGKFTSHAELFQRAEELTNHTLTDFRRMSRPLAVEKWGQVGEMAYTYKSPMFNQFNSLMEFSRDALKGKPGPLLAALGMSAVLGGMTAMPLVDVMDSGWNWTKEGIAKFAPQHYPKVAGLGVKGSIINQGNTFAANDVVQRAIGKTPAKFLGDTYGYGAVSAATHAQMASRFSSAIGDISNPLASMAPVAQEAKEWGSAGLGLLNPNRTTAVQGVYDALMPPIGKGNMEVSMPDFKGEKQGDKQGYITPTKVMKEQNPYYRTKDEENLRRIGMTSLQEATTKSSNYIANQEDQRYVTAQDTSMDRFFNAVKRHDQADMVKYAKSFYENKGDDAGFSSGLDAKIKDYIFAPEQRAMMKIDTMRELSKAMNIRKLQGH